MASKLFQNSNNHPANTANTQTTTSKALSGIVKRIEEGKPPEKYQRKMFSFLSSTPSSSSSSSSSRLRRGLDNDDTFDAMNNVVANMMLNLTW